MSTVTKRTITAVNIAKGRTLQIKLKEYFDDGTSRSNSLTCDQLYHDDVTKVFDKLKPHLAKICDLREFDTLVDINDHENEILADKILIHGIDISGSFDAEGIVIHGSKMIGDKLLKLDSPWAGFEDDYEFGAELAELAEAIRFEAKEYLFNGKYAIKQQEIEFEEGSVAEDKQFDDTAKEVLKNIGDSIIISPKSTRKNNKKASVTMSVVVDAAEAM